MAATIIVWFRRDLRLHDNHALAAACRDGTRPIPVYIFAPGEEQPWPPGAASRWWLHHSLQALDGALESLGLQLLILRGDVPAMLSMICRRSGAEAVYWNRLYDPATVARDARVTTELESGGIRTENFPGYLLREPWEVMTGARTPYKVFTAYCRACLALGDPPQPEPQPRPTPVPNPGIDGQTLDALRLLPRIRWDAGFYDYWQPGEQAAWQRVRTFTASGLQDYASARDRLAGDGISRLSPHLHFGEISPGSLWHAVIHESAAGEQRSPAADAYLRQLLWRDFAHHLLFHFPHITDHNFKPAFDAFPWRRESRVFDAWKGAETGIPLIDAGMRELWHTGFMHNRVRMNVASFLTKNAGIHWRAGARWFWNTLVDANLANNTLGWQWVAGSGPDAAPYFRIFNPVAQGRRFDPHGAYVRRWIPRLSGLPDKHIHAPWTAPREILDRAGVRLGSDYPNPTLDLKTSRQWALEAYKRTVARRP